jgi:hypothetical protein
MPGRLVFVIAAASGLALTTQAAAHGCHYTCECGPLRDFGCQNVHHRHLHMLCLPVRCERKPECEQKPLEGACRHVTPQ